VQRRLPASAVLDEMLQEDGIPGSIGLGGRLGSCKIRLGKEFGHTPLSVGMEVDDCTATKVMTDCSDSESKDQCLRSMQ